MKYDLGIARKEDKLSTPYKVKAENPAPIIMDVDTQKRIVTGLYNTYNFLDSDNDVLLPGCALKSISEHGPNSQATPKIKHALFHDLTKLPGKIMVLEEKEVEIQGQKLFGLYFETKMSSTEMGVDTLIKYQEQIYDNHSIGFRYLQLEYIDSDATNWLQLCSSLMNPQKAIDEEYMYIVKEINLFEGSTVSFGANSLTPYLGVKDATNKSLVQMSMFERIDRINNQLKNGTISDNGMMDLQLQLIQIKQMVKEMFETEPFVKPTKEIPQPDGSKSDDQKRDQDQKRVSNFLSQI